MLNISKNKLNFFQQYCLQNYYIENNIGNPRPAASLPCLIVRISTQTGPTQAGRGGAEILKDNYFPEINIWRTEMLESDGVRK